jgi:hypothetical protein
MMMMMEIERMRGEFSSIYFMVLKRSMEMLLVYIRDA